MQVQCKNRGIIFRAVGLAILASLLWAAPSSAQNNLSYGHQVLLKKGLQIKALVSPMLMYQNDSCLDFDLFNASGFTTFDIGNTSWPYDLYVDHEQLPGGDEAWDFARWVTDTNPGRIATGTYISNLVSIQLDDEQSIVSSALPTIATEVTALKTKFPSAMIYTNQSALFHDVPLTSSILNQYIQTVQPDMLSFTEYPFRWQGGGGTHDYQGGSPTEMYEHIELYRNAGLAGLDGTGSQPIPVSMYAQVFSQNTHYTLNGRQPTESEFRLQQFAGWAAGMKAVEAWPTMNRTTEITSMFFEGTDPLSQTPTEQFYQYAELNRQSGNLGDALVRLVSTDFRMEMGSHGTGTGVTNTLPSGVSAFDTSTDPYLTGISATNLGTLNNGLSGDVLYGSYEPLDPALVADGCENDHYFMIVNGLSDGTGSAYDCRQQIHLDFDFGTSGINSLMRLSRETGLVENVPLIHNGGSLYSLELTLDGGTGDLFKYDTGSEFIGKATANNPGLITNGDFESVTNGEFDGWTRTNSAVTYVDYTNEPIDGDHSVRMVRTGSVSGNLYQDFNFAGLDITGLSDFQIDVDFAILDGAEDGDRLFSMLTYNRAGGLVDCLDIDKEAEGYELRGFYPNGTSGEDFESGLYADPTTDTTEADGGRVNCFDDEDPVINHLTLIGRGYGTEEYSTIVILNGEAYRLEGNFGTGNGSEITRLLFLGTSGNSIDKDYLIDNVVVANLNDESYIPGDANKDGKVDGSDVTILANNWQCGVSDNTYATWEMGDFNRDGKVDGSDVTILANHWQEGVSAATAAVPEPGMMILLLTLAGSFLLRWRRR